MNINRQQEDIITGYIDSLSKEDFKHFLQTCSNDEFRVTKAALQQKANREALGKDIAISKQPKSKSTDFTDYNVYNSVYEYDNRVKSSWDQMGPSHVIPPAMRPD